eukprot:250757-Chlamydomonas_euryale.AAC.19
MVPNLTARQMSGSFSALRPIACKSVGGARVLHKLHSRAPHLLRPLSDCLTECMPPPLRAATWPQHKNVPACNQAHWPASATHAPHLRIAAALCIEHALVVPAMLIVADERSVGVGRERGLAGARQAKEAARKARMRARMHALLSAAT